MRIVEKQPNEDPSVSFLDGGAAELEEYFQGELETFNCSIEGDHFHLVCYQDGLQADKDKIKALYGPVVICGDGLESLSKKEAEKVQNYFAENHFDLESIKLQ